MIPHFLAEASKLLFSSLELEPTMDQITRLTVPSLADGCEVVLETDGVAELVAFYHHDPVMTDMVRAFARRYPFRPSETAAIREGRAVLVPTVDDDILRTLARSDEHLLFLQSMRMVSVLSVPLRVRDRTFGALRLTTTTPGRVLGAADLALAEELAARVSIAVDNARLYAAERASKEQAQIELTARRQSDSRLQEIIDHSAPLIYVRDRAFRLTFANREYRRRWGGKEPAMAPEAIHRLLESTKRVFETKQPISSEEIVPHPDGGECTYLITKFPICDEHGEVIEVCGVATDITTMKHLEAQLWQSQKMEALGRFAGAVAHDFSNLCLAMKRFVAERDFAGIDGCVDRAAVMTRQLLMFARKQALESVDVDVNAAIDKSEELLRRVLNRGMQLEKSLCKETGFVRADAGQLEHVLVNLVVNARDAMPAGGRVHISTALIDDGGKRTLRVTVADTGTGMDEATRRRLFEPFFTTKAEGRGTGFGLSIVYGFVKRAGGRIDVETKLGEGSAFHLLLPCVDAPAPAARRDPTPVSSTHGATILLVEDDDDVREFVAQALRVDGYHVLLASDGATALRIAREHPSRIDLLLCDIVMPELSGSEVAMRLLPLRPQIKILHVSGYPGDALSRYGELLPRVAFLEKPFTAESLGKKVRDVLTSDVVHA